MDRLWIVDGHAAFFRAYHAIRGGMTSPVTGEPTHLVYGFTGTLLNMIRTHRPTKLVVVIDAAGDTETFRTKLYPEYKANRDEAPEDFGPQVERCLELLRLMRIPVFGLEGVEADDTIASIITQCASDHADLAIRIASRDKDLTQLCSPRVDMFDAMKDALVTPSDVFKTEGVEPHMVGDILALMGDTADNIPGVPGIGPKTAAKLIIEHGDLDGLYEALPSLKGKKMQAIGEHRETTALARQLVDLKRDLDTGFDLDDADFDPGQIDLEGLDGLCRQLGFNSYPRSFRELAGAEASAPENAVTVGAPVSRKRSCRVCRHSLTNMSAPCANATNCCKHRARNFPAMAGWTGWRKIWQASARRLPRRVWPRWMLWLKAWRQCRKLFSPAPRWLWGERLKRCCGRNRRLRLKMTGARACKPNARAMPLLDVVWKARTALTCM